MDTLSGRPETVKDWVTFCKKKGNHGVAMAVTHRGIAWDTGVGPSPEFGGWAWLTELQRRFRLLPDHAKAFGFDIVTDERQRQMISAVSEASWSLEQCDVVSAWKHVQPWQRQLSNSWRARDLLEMCSNDLISFVAMDYEELQNLSEEQATAIRETIRMASKVSSDRPHPDRLRALNPVTTLRRLQRMQRTKSYFISQVLETIGDHKGKSAQPIASYAEIEGQRRRVDNQKRSAEGKSLVDLNTEFATSFLDVIEGSRRARMAEFHVINLGMQKIAEDQKWSFAMLTVSLPGEWHSARTGKKSGRKSDWNESDVAEASAALQKHVNVVSTRLKQLLVDEDGNSVGFGVVIREPHKDGVKHAHMAIFAPVENLIAIRDYSIKFCRKAGEKQALGKLGVFETTQGVRMHFLAWQPSDKLKAGVKASSPASYLYKYLKKALGDDLALGAWKAASQGRQISWLNMGHGFVGRWRAVFAMTQSQQSVDDPDFLKARDAMFLARNTKDAAHWADALRIVSKLGGDSLPWTVISEERETSYGDTVKVSVGYSTDDGEIISAIDFDRRWVVMPTSQLDRIGDMAACAFAAAMSDMDTDLNDDGSVSVSRSRTRPRPFSEAPLWTETDPFFSSLATDAPWREAAE